MRVILGFYQYISTFSVAIVGGLSIFLTPLMALATPLSLTDIQVIERDSLGMPFDCSIQSKNNFSFVMETKESAQLSYDRESACELANNYRQHIDNTLEPFWPLHNKLGLLVRKSESYNAYFHGNLYNENMPPHLGLIYVEGIETAPQVPVWTHEYGHAVFDEYIRSQLNMRVNFDSRVRESRKEDSDFESRADVQLLYKKIKELDEQIAPLNIELKELQESLTVHLEIMLEISKELGELFKVDPELRSQDVVDEINRKSTENSQRMKVLRSQRAELDAKWGPLSDKRSILYAELQIKRLAFNEEHGKNGPVDISLYRYLHEFFADLFAVVVHTESSIIARVLGDIFGRENYVEERNFGEENFAYSPLLFKFDESHGPHHFFTPTRQFIDRNRLTQIISQGHGKQLLEQILEASRDLLLEVSFGEDKEKYFFDFTPVLEKFNKIEQLKFEDIKAFLAYSRSDFHLRMNGLTMSSFYRWCENDKDACVGLMRREVPKGDGGLFRTPLNFKLINETFTERLNELLTNFSQDRANR